MAVKVSVIMPSLNVAPYIRQCVESVMNQTLHDIEILCIDAGSTDGTREILAEYAAKDTRIRLIDSPVRSYGYQVNRGIDEAQGEYIGIVETDDYVSPNMFAHLYQIAQKYGKVDVAHADMIWVWGHNDYQIRHIFDEKHKKRYLKRFDNKSILLTHLSDSNVWDAIYRREFLLKTKIRCNESSGAAYQDIGFLQQVHTLANSFVYSDQPLYYYRVDRDGSSSSEYNRVRFVCQEWQFIIGSNLVNQPEWEMHCNFACTRLIQCFLWEIDRCIRMLKKQEWLQDAEWFLAQVNEVSKRGWWTAEYLSREERLRILIIQQSIDNYVAYVKAIYLLQKQKEESIFSWSEHGALLFGSGIRGKIALKYLKKVEHRVIGFVDNDSSLWGKEVEGVPVFSPEKVPERIGNGDVIICNKYYWEEISDQLRAMGIPDEKVHVFNP